VAQLRSAPRRAACSSAGSASGSATQPFRGRTTSPASNAARSCGRLIPALVSVEVRAIPPLRCRALLIVMRSSMVLGGRHRRLDSRIVENFNPSTALPLL
jgi:hypothetical protein